MISAGIILGIVAYLVMVGATDEWLKPSWVEDPILAPRQLGAACWPIVLPVIAGARIVRWMVKPKICKPSQHIMGESTDYRTPPKRSSSWAKWTGSPR